MRARMEEALGITEQGFSSGDACRVPWANETTTATTQYSATGKEAFQKLIQKIDELR